MRSLHVITNKPKLQNFNYKSPTHLEQFNNKKNKFYQLLKYFSFSTRKNTLFSQKKFSLPKSSLQTTPSVTLRLSLFFYGIYIFRKILSPKIIPPNSTLKITLKFSLFFHGIYIYFEKFSLPKSSPQQHTQPQLY